MKRRFPTLVAIAVAVSALVAPGAASASTTEAIAETGGMTLTLGVLGAPLNVAVTVDEIGHITEVTVDDPAYTETRSDEHKVRFTTADDTTRIEVKAKGDKVKAEVKTADLSAIVGSHTWAGKLFGSETDSVVTFDVVDSAGSPEVANVAVTSLFPADATYAIGAVENEFEDGEAESEVKIGFMWDGYTMTLKIEAEMEFDHDDDDGVKLKVELKGKDQRKVREEVLADLVGSYTWDGLLCDGTAVAVTYTVSDTGEVSVNSVDGVDADAYKLDTESHGFEIEFKDSDAKLEVELKQDDGLWELKVKSKTTEKCGHDDDDESDHDDDHGDDDHHDHDDDDDDHDDD
jgi:hypothetical protein